MMGYNITNVTGRMKIASTLRKMAFASESDCTPQKSNFEVLAASLVS